MERDGKQDKDAQEDQEEEELRSVALENARTILEKRQRAERQLLSTKNALEQRTQQLARSVALMQATLPARVPVTARPTHQP